MDEIFTYPTDLPPGVHEMVAPCGDGCYTLYINTRDSRERQIEAYRHALGHIRSHDHDREDVQEIETKAHEYIKGC